MKPHRASLPFALAVAALVALADASWAQTVGQESGQGTGINIAALHRLDGDQTRVVWQGLAVSQMVGRDLYNDAGAYVGEVEGVLADDEDRIAGVIVGVGGFLGFGRKEVVLPIDQLRIEPRLDGFVTGLPPQELEGLEAWTE